MFLLFLSQAIYAQDFTPEHLAWSDASHVETEAFVEAARNSASGTMASDAPRLLMDPIILGASETAEVAYRPGCTIGSGYKPGSNSCHQSSAVDMGLLECEGEFDTDRCILVNTHGKLYDLSRKTTSSSEAQSKLEAEMDIEGSGYGVSASASAKYSSNNLKTSKSVTYWTHFHGDAYANVIHNFATLSLKSDAANWLRTDVKGFIKQFGSHYIQQISYSTSFHASSSFTETTACEGSAFEAALNVSYMDYASGSAKVSGSNSKCAADTMIESNIEYFGEVIVPTEDENKENGGQTSIVAALNQFKIGLKADPTKHVVPTKITIRPWTDVDVIRQTIQDNHPQTEWNALFALFGQEDPGQTALQYLTLDWIFTKAVKKTADLFRDYECHLDEATADNVHQEAKALSEQMGSHKAVLDNMTPGEILSVESQIKAGNFDWLVGYQAAWNDPMGDLIEICPLPCTSWNWIPKAAIAGHNKEHMFGTVAQCKAACEAKDWCRSFDYWNYGTGECDLSDVTAAEAGLKFDYEDNPYDYYEKACPENQLSVGAAASPVTSRLSPVGTYQIEECTMVEKSCIVIEHCTGEVTCTGAYDAKCSECEPGFSGPQCNIYTPPQARSSHEESMGAFGSLLDRMDTYLSSKGFRRRVNAPKASVDE